MIVVWALLSIMLVALTAHYIAHPRKISDAHWYGSFTEYIYLYIFPPTFAFMGTYTLAEFFNSLGLNSVRDFFYLASIPVTAIWFVGFFAMLGVPMPPFMTPKWIRDRRKADREAKRQRTLERKTARDSKPEEDPSGL
ncbi:hypothetical protein BJH93_00810 [Kocuria polaris]|nr:hypothetical protein [Kocuria polaris]